MCFPFEAVITQSLAILFFNIFLLMLSSSSQPNKKPFCNNFLELLSDTTTSTVHVNPWFPCHQPRSPQDETFTPVDLNSYKPELWFAVNPHSNKKYSSYIFNNNF